MHNGDCRKMFQALNQPVAVMPYQSRQFLCYFFHLIANFLVSDPDDWKTNWKFIKWFVLCMIVALQSMLLTILNVNGKSLTPIWFGEKICVPLLVWAVLFSLNNRKVRRLKPAPILNTNTFYSRTHPIVQVHVDDQLIS